MSSSQSKASTVTKISGINSQKIEMDFAKSGEDTTAMNSNTQNTPNTEPKTKVEPKPKAPKKKSKAVLEMEAMKEEMRLMKEALVKQQKITVKQLREKEQLEEQARLKEEEQTRLKTLIKKQEQELLRKASQPKKGGKPKAEVQHQPHFRFRTVEMNGMEEILMLDSDEGVEIPLFEVPAEHKELLAEMTDRFRQEYDDCFHEEFFDGDNLDDAFGSNLANGERDVFYLKDRTKYWNEMSKEELIEQCRARHYLTEFRSRNKDAMVEPSWAKTEEGVWVRWGKGTVYGLKKDLLGGTLKPKVAINIKSAEGRKQIKTAPEESRCEAEASKSAGRCCKSATFQIPEDGKYKSRQVCITHMKAVHQTSIICKQPLAFGCRWGWSDTPLMCLTVGETKKSIDQYCKDKLKATPTLEEGFKQIKGNSYTKDDLGNSEGYKKFRID